MKKLIWLLPVLLVLLGLYILIDSPLEDKQYRCPVGEDADGLEFTARDGSWSIRTEDQEAIHRLRRSFRWANAHTFCCLASSYSSDYVLVYALQDGQRVAEAMKCFDNLSVPGYNLEFRYLLRELLHEAHPGS